MSKEVFVNRRRKGKERRETDDPCKNMSIDIYHRKRRKASDRRQPRTLDEDYYAFLASVSHEPDDSSDYPYH